MDRVFALEDGRRRLGLTLIASLLALMPSPLAAQTPRPPLSELVPLLYLDSIDRNENALREVFGPSVQVERATLATAFDIIDLAAGQLSTFPLPSSAGGFTWNFDPASGAFNRGSNSFGPIYAERALTIGARHFNFGTAYQRVTFDRLEDQPLRGGAITSYTGVRNTGQGFGIFVADSLDLNVRTDTSVTFATYGLTNRWDVGVAIPYNSVQVDASLTARIGTTVNGVDPQVVVTNARSGSAQGIGDIVARTKFHFLKRGGGGLAAAVDVRLPTGDETNLLGVAGAQTKMYLIASAAANKLSPHVNVGYTVSGSSAAASDPDTIVVAPPDEFNYSGGVDVEAGLRATFAFDMIGRTLKDFGTLARVPSAFGQNLLHFVPQTGRDLNLLLGSTGIKVNPFGNMLITGNMLFPMTSSGLTDNLTWMVGIDYSF